ncbi:hypothetical protein HHK36_032087 [Tetracentron sinense]|uniref:Uncharacterized protein n=1 Tax=Tetracentron sinense TaxID=13715 RepID=A0A834Y7W8_TETSI|nr:hypothetical protein HHK36_032087 [Tetracentron sinense]
MYTGNRCIDGCPRVVFPGALLQEIDQQKSLESSVFGSACPLKCSVVGDISISRVLDKSVHKSSPNVKSIDSSNYAGSITQTYSGLNDFSRSSNLDALGLDNTRSLVTDSASVDKPVKKISKKKNKKKKVKEIKMFPDNIAVIGSSKCGQDYATACKQSSKEEMVNAKRDKVTANCDSTTVDCDKSVLTVPASAVISSISACGQMGEYSKDASNYNGKLFSECSCGGTSDFTRRHVQADAWKSNHGETSTCSKRSNVIMQGLEKVNTIEKKIIPECNNYCTEDLHSNHGETSTCSKVSNVIIQEIKTLNTVEKKIILESNNCCIGELKRNVSFDHSSLYKSGETNSIICVEDCNGCSSERTKSSIQCFSANSFHAAPDNEFRHDNIASRSNLVNKCSHHPNIIIGKENKHLVWQKSQKHIRDACAHETKISNHIPIRADASSQEKNLLMNRNSFSSDALLPTPIVSSAGHHSAAHGVKDVGKNEQVMYGRSPGNVLVESSQWVAQQRFHGGLYQCVSQSRQEERTGGNKDWGKSKRKPSQSYMHENNNNSKKGVGSYKANLSMIQNWTNLSQKESLQVPSELHHHNSSNAAEKTSKYLPRSTISGVSDRALLASVQTYSWMKVPRTEHVLVGSLHASLDNKKRNPLRLEIEPLHEDKIRQDSTTRMTLQKWIPVSRKDSSMMKSIEAVGVSNGPNDNTACPCKGTTDSHPEQYAISLCGPVASSYPGNTCLISSNEKERVMPNKGGTLQFQSQCTAKENPREEIAKDFVASSNKAMDTALLVICSQTAVRALNAAYRLQIASESVRIATGCSLAEFERLLHSATPVIASTYVLQHCDVCLENRFFQSPLCKHQTPNIPLGAVWNWYEKPGNYGLEVEAEDSQNEKGLCTDSVSFRAHFVPFLSAVQLFGHPNVTNPSRSTGNLSPEVPDYGGTEPCSSPSMTSSDIPCPEAVKTNLQVDEIRVSISLDLVGEPVSSSNISPSDGKDSPSSTSVPACSDDIELIFEFFEYEQPQLRKPLYDKIMELVKTGASNHEVFGDPAKLKCMSLHDLHPASWYSVAWYPIYRIPEGSLRATFLTYHSLGHWVGRCVSTDAINENVFVLSPLCWDCKATMHRCWEILELSNALMKSEISVPAHHSDAASDPKVILLPFSIVNYFVAGGLHNIWLILQTILVAPLFIISDKSVVVQLGECWFYSKKAVGSSFKGFTAFDSSEILKERLRTLEETALLFARGCICKDGIRVANRQPDYEFFLSRKR